MEGGSGQAYPARSIPPPGSDRWIHKPRGEDRACLGPCRFVVVRGAERVCHFLVIPGSRFVGSAALAHGLVDERNDLGGDELGIISIGGQFDQNQYASAAAY